MLENTVYLVFKHLVQWCTVHHCKQNNMDILKNAFYTSKYQIIIYFGVPQNHACFLSQYIMLLNISTSGCIILVGVKKERNDL